MLLRRAGFEVVEAANAADAVAALARESVSLVVSDINMPGNERLQLVHQVGAAHPGLPIILLTGYPSAETAIKSVNAGVVSYLEKPVNASVLLDAVQRAIGLYEARRVVARNAEHLRKWAEDVEHIDHQMQHARNASQNRAVGMFLDVSLQRLTASIADLRDVVDVLTSSPAGAAGMRTHELERAVKDAIAVLERTKRDFKSKELAELRQRLESLVEEAPTSESPKRTAGRPADL